MMNKPTMVKVYSVDELDAIFDRNVHPLKQFYYTMRGRLNRGLWYLRGLIWDRFNVVKARHLPPTWVDRDHLLSHIMFEVLCRFVEKEDGYKAHYFEGADKYTDEECEDSDPEAYGKWGMRRQTIFAIELKRLYDWWNSVYVPYCKDEESHYLKVGAATDEQRWKEEERINEELTANLISLVKIRGDMWT